MSPHQHAFLAAYRECGNVTEAAFAAHVGRSTHYDWLAHAGYAAAFAEAEEIAIEHLETEARTRATVGAIEPVIYQGRLCFDVARDATTGRVIYNDAGEPILSETPLMKATKSDNLLMFILKSKRPDKYRDSARIEISGELNLIVERLEAGRQRLKNAG